MKERALRHAVRLSSFVVAVAPVAVAVLDTLPWQGAASLSAVALVAGETAQRVEDAKTRLALLTAPPE